MHRVHLRNEHPPWTKTFEHPPVILGRDDTASNCPLPDALVSRVHASIDVREDRIWVRDAGSRNGTLVNGHPVPSDRWSFACNLQGHCEIRIGNWVIRVHGQELREGAGFAADFLTAYTRDATRAELSGTFVSEGAVLPVAAHPAAPVSRDTVVHPPLRVGRAFAHVIAARRELLDALRHELEAAAPAEQAQLVAELVAMCPGIEHEPAARGLLERHGQRPLPHSLESGSAVALQELARAFVPGVPPLASADDVFAFARRVKSSVDELLGGLVPLFAGLDRFEEQMAIRPGQATQPASSRMPRVPRDAARRLFDWRDPTDHAVRAVRTDLIDLTMHQVALINGVMQGVNVLLTELAPATLERAWERQQSERGALARFFGAFRSHRAKWELYRERHSDLADEENERFRVIFGPEFAAEYKQAGNAIRPLEIPRLTDTGRSMRDLGRERLPVVAGQSAPPPRLTGPAPAYPSPPPQHQSVPPQPQRQFGSTLAIEPRHKPPTGH